MLQNEQSALVDRVEKRRKLKGSNMDFSAAGKKAGVENYANFLNAGIIGMYNCWGSKLAEKRGIKKGELYEHMGARELSANDFRATMTVAQLEKEGGGGQERAEGVHREVGQHVRGVYKKYTGKFPEEEMQEKLTIPEVKKRLKRAKKELQKKDQPKKLPKKSE